MENNLLKRIWNAFTNRDPTYNAPIATEIFSSRPDRVRYKGSGDRSYISSVVNRLAIDVSQITFRHCRIDDEGNYKEDINSGLNDILSLEANIDQTSQSFLMDVVISMCDEGYVAGVPVDTNDDPNDTNSFDILTMRTGKIIEWACDRVKVRVYNDRTGRREELWFKKNKIAIFENPMYMIMNERNSTAQRLLRKIALLDMSDEQLASGKLDIIIGLPYVVRTEAKRKEADERMKEIERQLAGSKYGIAYTDGTEHITQLNRPLENGLLNEIKNLRDELYSQLGITEAILNGTADEKQMLNYYTRTIEPLVTAIVGELKRKFLTKTARSQDQSVMAFRDPFKLVPINNIADIADKFTRNEIMSSNEFRQKVGLKPSSDPKADQLINSNLNHPEEEEPAETPEASEEE